MHRRVQCMQKQAEKCINPLWGDQHVAKIYIMSRTVLSRKVHSTCEGISGSSDPNRTEHIVKQRLCVYGAFHYDYEYFQYEEEFGEQIRHWKIMRRIKSKYFTHQSSVPLSSFPVLRCQGTGPSLIIFIPPPSPTLHVLTALWHKSLFSTPSLCHAVDRIAFSHPWIHFLPTLLGMLLEIWFTLELSLQLDLLLVCSFPHP